MQIKQTDFKGSFEIEDGNGQPIKLKFDKWYKNEARANFGGDSYLFRPVKLSSTRFEILKNEYSFGEIKFNWKGQITFYHHTDFVPGEVTYSLKPKGFFKRTYEVYNDQHELVLALRAKRGKRGLLVNLEMTTFPVTPSGIEQTLLFLLTGVSITQYQKMMGGGAA